MCLSDHSKCRCHGGELNIDRADCLHRFRPTCTDNHGHCRYKCRDCDTFHVVEYLLIKLTVGVASPLSDDAFILYNNCPAALCNAETTKHPKVFLTVYKGSCTILPNGPAETAAGLELLTEVPTFSQFGHNIQRERNHTLRFRCVCQIELRGRTFPGGESLIAIILR